MKEQDYSVTKMVAANIRQIRKYRNFTQEYVAAKLSISQNAYSKLELGYSKISIDRIFQLAIVFDTEVRQLITIDHSSGVKLDIP